MQNANAGKWLAHCHIAEHMHSTQILDFKRLLDKNIIEKHGKGVATFYTLIEN